MQRQMRQSKHEFFHTGVDKQKQPDIVFDMRRIADKKIDSWTPQEKREAREWMVKCKKRFDEFAQEINNLL